MDVERELAALEKELASQDPALARKLESFDRSAVSPPRLRKAWRVALLWTFVCLVLAVVSALAVGTANAPASPAGRVVQQHSGGTG
ncbi:DUF3040 domain-containing protein [Streptomyces sp. NPDC004561]